MATPPLIPGKATPPTEAPPLPPTSDKKTQIPAKIEPEPEKTQGEKIKSGFKDFGYRILEFVSKPLHFVGKGIQSLVDKMPAGATFTDTSKGKIVLSECAKALAKPLQAAMAHFAQKESTREAEVDSHCFSSKEEALAALINSPFLGTGKCVMYKEGPDRKLLQLSFVYKEPFEPTDIPSTKEAEKIIKGRGSLASNFVSVKTLRIKEHEYARNEEINKHCFLNKEEALEAIEGMVVGTRAIYKDTDGKLKAVTITGTDSRSTHEVTTDEAATTINNPTVLIRPGEVYGKFESAKPQPIDEWNKAILERCFTNYDDALRAVADAGVGKIAMFREGNEVRYVKCSEEALGESRVKGYSTGIVRNEEQAKRIMAQSLKPG